MLHFAVCDEEEKNDGLSALTLISPTKEERLSQRSKNRRSSQQKAEENQNKTLLVMES
jgi:hypothetical protein